MKRIWVLIAFALTCTVVQGQLLNKVKEKVKDKVNQRIDKKTDETIDKGLDKTESTIDKGVNKAGDAIKEGKKTDKKATTPGTTEEEDNTVSPSTETGTKPSYKAYQNYDFIAGDTILFEDHFFEDEDGEFPSHWVLERGQGTLSKVADVQAFSLTDGNYAEVFPRMKTKHYLDNEFTLEFDYYPVGYGYVGVIFKYLDEKGAEKNAYIFFQATGGIRTNYLPQSKHHEAKHPAEKQETFAEKWHHGAVSYKNGQLKCYIDQHRIMVVPNLNIVPVEFGFGGLAKTEYPVIFANIRAAKGSKAKTIGSKFTDAKIVTHGITFDFGKAVIKPESMGTLNMIVKILNDNPELNFEVGGHASKSGNGANAVAVNQTLSEQRADAVRTQLISMGIDESRLTTKGYGETQPIADNATPEGRANNQRVEFTKL
jgi:outer membrane protein OmpA-like peptidoglycan-associated protein